MVPRESFQRGVHSADDTSETLGQSPEIPDVRGMLAKNPRFSELNLGINTVYVKMADMFQDIYDPDRKFSPSWYGFAPFASRTAGKSIRMAEKLTAVMEKYGQAPPHKPEWEHQLDQEYPEPDEREMASNVLSLLGPAPAAHGGPQPQGIGDLTHLGIAAKRMGSIIRKQSGSLSTRLTRVARTVRNMLEDGNRRIVTEIGVAGQDYLEFRKDRQPSPEEVLNEFTVEGTPLRPEQAREVYQAMEDIVLGDGPLVTEWDKKFPPESFDRSNFLVASFAAYEAARLETDPEIKNRWIEQAGVVMAFREQMDTVQQAFEDTGSADEVSRKELMKLMTPWVGVPTYNFEWSFREYAGQSLPPADRNPFTPRAAEYSWGHFPTRWGGILNFFGDVFEDTSSIWPMPSPDPSVPL